MKSNTKTIEFIPYLNAKKANYYKNSALQYEVEGAPFKALNEWKHALEFQPNNDRFHYSIAALYRDLDQLKKAAYHFRKVIKFNPKNSDALNALASIALEEKKPQQALSYYKKALAVDPSNIVTITELSDLFNNLGRFQDALSVINRGLELYPNHRDLLVDKAIVMKIYDDSPAALSLLKQVTDRDSEDLHALYITAIIYMEMECLDFAIYYFRKALKYRYDTATVYPFITALFYRGELEEAKENLQDMLFYCPKEHQALIMLANIYIRENRMEESMELLEPLYKSDELNTASELTMLAVCYTEMAQKSGNLAFYRKAETILNKALKLEPDSLPIEILRIKTFLKRGKVDRALKRAESLLNKHPAKSELYRLLGDIYERVGNEQNAQNSRTFAALLDGSDCN